MTESEWLICEDPQLMLQWLVGEEGEPGAAVRRAMGMRPSDRKLRLFACACRRQMSSLPWDGDSAGWLHMEEYPDDSVPADGNPSHFIPAIEHAMLFLSESIQDRPPARLSAALLRDIIGNPFRPVTLYTETWEVPLTAMSASASESTDAISGAVVSCPWLTPTVVSLAVAAYEERPWRKCGGTGQVEDGHLDPVRMMVLADALEEAGCDNENILRHLRGEEWTLDAWMPKRSPCVRGCVVVDLLRGVS